MGKILVALDKTNPSKYIVSIENNEGNRRVFGCNDADFDKFIESLQKQRMIARIQREQNMCDLR